MRRGRLTTVIALIGALVLSGCAGLPVSGPVNAGLEVGDEGDAPDFSFVPDRPQPGATPTQIVSGFLRAGSGPADNWARAGLFLAPGATWNPNAGVTVDLQGERRPVENGEDGVAVTLSQVATVDETGAYSEAGIGPTTLQFELAEQPDGEWRITEAPDGVVLDEAFFPIVYHRYPLAFFTPSWEYLVPDVRWFPTTNARTSIANALIAGPSPWLAGSVVTAFPEGITLDPPAVQMRSGVADVELDRTALALDATTLDRMQAQLEASLSSARVSGVEMSVSNTPLAARAAVTRTTTVAGAPLVLSEAGFGFLRGGELDPIAVSPALAALSPAPVSIQVSPVQDVAAVRLPSGDVARVDTDGAVVVDQREGLIEPTVDSFGYVWSAPRSAPSALRASDGTNEVDLAGAFPEAVTISAMALSRDGTRLAAVGSAGGRTLVWVAGVVRDANNQPTGLGVALELSSLSVSAQAMAWLDDVTLGVITGADDQPTLIEQPVGGPGSTAGAPMDVAGIAGANQPSTVWLRGADGTLYLRRGSNWQQIGSDVSVLATQQGLP